MVLQYLEAETLNDVNELARDNWVLKFALVNELKPIYILEKDVEEKEII